MFGVLCMQWVCFPLYLLSIYFQYTVLLCLHLSIKLDCIRWCNPCQEGNELFDVQLWIWHDFKTRIDSWYVGR